jgi:hypothetical protein
MRVNRDRKRARKQTRRRRLRVLRAKLERATDAAERRRIIARMRRISPTTPVPEA